MNWANQNSKKISDNAGIRLMFSTIAIDTLTVSNHKRKYWQESHSSQPP